MADEPRGQDWLIERFTFAAAAARTGATGFFNQDIGKLGYQQDTGQWWRLLTPAPTWALVNPLAFADLTGQATNAQLVNSGITIAGVLTALGGSITQDTITGLAATGIVKRTAANTLAIATAGTDYLTANQTITLSGDVTGTGATAITTALANIPTATPAVGTILYTNIAAPANPASGKVSIYTDSTDLRLHDRNASGVTGTTVVADTGAANNFLTAISAAGAISKAQPAFSNLSGSVAAGQMPALTGDVTTSAGTVATTIAANAVTNAKMATMAANTVKANATAGVAVPTDVTAATARSSSLLNIDQRNAGIANANYTILATDRYVATTTTAFTAQRTATLPAANGVNAGQVLYVGDDGSAITASFSLLIARGGTDTINKQTSSLNLTSPLSSVILESDGVSNWTVISRSPAVRLTFLTSGTTYTTTIGAKAMYAECVGGGGGGGGAVCSAASKAAAGSGGGGGGYAAVFIVNPKASYTYAIGGAGTAGTTAGAAGGAGGNTTWDSPSVCTANGGTGGSGDATGYTGLFIINTGGAGGTATVGDVKVPGQQGWASISLTTTQTISGAGGNAGIGFGQGGGQNAPSNAGNAGTGFGGGGAGAANSTTTQNTAGGAGAAGCVVVTEYF
jgi:hypothetical protein